MLRFYFVRHGETMSNVWKCMQGHSDTPLTKKGIMQGKKVAKVLKDISFLALYTSTSERAYDTACLINEYHDMPIQMHRGLKEMNFGSLETKPEHIIGGPSSYRINYDWRPFGGDTIDDLSDRMKKTLHNIAELHKSEHGNILCVSHSIAILAALRFIDQDLYDQRMNNDQYIDNCSITIIDWDQGRFKIHKINETKL